MPACASELAVAARTHAAQRVRTPRRIASANDNTSCALWWCFVCLCGSAARDTGLASEARQGPWKLELAEDAGTRETGDRRGRVGPQRQHQQPAGAGGR